MQSTQTAILQVSNFIYAAWDTITLCLCRLFGLAFLALDDGAFLSFQEHAPHSFECDGIRAVICKGEGESVISSREFFSIAAEIWGTAPASHTPLQLASMSTHSDFDERMADWRIEERELVRNSHAGACHMGFCRCTVRVSVVTSDYFM